MTKILTTHNIRQIVTTIGFNSFILGLIKYLQSDFNNWESFDKTSRVAFYKNSGVMELMPICGDNLFSFKYVNGHPNNTLINKLTVLGVGMLAKVSTGEPIMISEMTLLTALRTAATSAMVSQLLARKDSKIYGSIGCGSQSEFQVLAHHAIFSLSTVYYYDVDTQAMKKFASNLVGKGFELIPCTSAKEVCDRSDIITTCTACVQSQNVILACFLKPGQHLNCIGGDSPNKTELDVEILKISKIFVEYFPQTSHEGEIQNLGDLAKERVSAEIWEVLNGTKLGRENDNEISLYDSVGFALEDYSVLRYVYDISEKFNIFEQLDLVPELDDCKNLYQKIQTKTSSHLGFTQKTNNHNHLKI
jgi:ornithine cyclodeaminase